MTLLLALWACGTPPDPEVVAAGAAVEAWEAGEALLASSPEQALARFDEARTHRSTDPILDAWRAKAMADAGQLEEAIALLGDVLARAPDLSEARFNRGAYLARLGKPAEAAIDIQRAVDDGVVAPREAVVDPDVALYIGHPAFGFLPRSPLEVRVKVPDRPIFMGSEFTVSLGVDGARPGPLDVVTGAVAPVTLVRVVEDDIASPGGRARMLDYTFKVNGAGELELGTVRVTSDRWSAEGPTMAVRTTAPPDRAVAESAQVDLSPVSRRIEGHTAPSSWIADGATWVLLGPDETERVEPDGLPSWVGQLRQDGDTVVELRRFDVEATRVRVTARGDVRLDGPPQR